MAALLAKSGLRTETEVEVEVEASQLIIIPSRYKCKAKVLDVHLFRWILWMLLAWDTETKCHYISFYLWIPIEEDWDWHFVHNA